MLVIGGAPAVAAASACDPCPPDCAMMKAQMAKADHPGKAKQEQNQPDSPCKGVLACAGVMAAALPSAPVVTVAFAPQAANLAVASDLPTPSRPPDRALRPPKQA